MPVPEIYDRLFDVPYHTHPSGCAVPDEGVGTRYRGHNGVVRVYVGRPTIGDWENENPNSPPNPRTTVHQLPDGTIEAVLTGRVRSTNTTVRVSVEPTRCECGSGIHAAGDFHARYCALRID